MSEGEKAKPEKIHKMKAGRHDEWVGERHHLLGRKELALNAGAQLLAGHDFENGLGRVDLLGRADLYKERARKNRAETRGGKRIHHTLRGQIVGAAAAFFIKHQKRQAQSLSNSPLLRAQPAAL